MEVDKLGISGNHAMSPLHDVGLLETTNRSELVGYMSVLAGITARGQLYAKAASGGFWQAEQATTKVLSSHGNCSASIHEHNLLLSKKRLTRLVNMAEENDQGTCQLKCATYKVM